MSPAFFCWETRFDDLFCVDGFEHLRRVPLGVNVFPHLDNFPVRADQKRAAHDSQIGFPEKRFHASYTISFNSLKCGIAQERKIQLLFCLEIRLGLHGIATAAENYRAGLVELCFGVAKLGRFADSTGSLRLGEKVKHHGLAAQFGERDFAAIVGRQTKLRCFVSHFHFDPPQESTRRAISLECH